jgi:hypothetical protein
VKLPKSFAKTSPEAGSKTSMRDHGEDQAGFIPVKTKAKKRRERRAALEKQHAHKPSTKSTKSKASPLSGGKESVRPGATPVSVTEKYALDIQAYRRKREIDSEFREKERAAVSTARASIKNKYKVREGVRVLVETVESKDLEGALAEHDSGPSTNLSRRNATRGRNVSDIHDRLQLDTGGRESPDSSSYYG